MGKQSESEEKKVARRKTWEQAPGAKCGRRSHLLGLAGRHSHRLGARLISQATHKSLLKLLPLSSIEFRLSRKRILIIEGYVIELDANKQSGEHCVVEIIMLGRAGRWRASERLRAII